MKATDLRIGNLVHLIGLRQGIVLEVRTSHARIKYELDGKEKQSHIYCENLEPIPLTEEWLVKFGAIHVFNSTRATDTSYRYGRFNLTYKKAYKYWYVTDSESDGYLSKVEFVHEWQNFVFVMDGEELEATP